MMSFLCRTKWLERGVISDYQVKEKIVETISMARPNLGDKVCGRIQIQAFVDRFDIKYYNYEAFGMVEASEFYIQDMNIQNIANNLFRSIIRGVFAENYGFHMCVAQIYLLEYRY
jgi:hypothetical protein